MTCLRTSAQELSKTFPLSSSFWHLIVLENSKSKQKHSLFKKMQKGVVLAKN